MLNEEQRLEVSSSLRTIIGNALKESVDPDSDLIAEEDDEVNDIGANMIDAMCEVFYTLDYDHFRVWREIISAEAIENLTAESIGVSLELEPMQVSRLYDEILEAFRQQDSEPFKELLDFFNEFIL